MIYLALPISSQIGWGVCGRYIAQELSRLVEVRLLTDDLKDTNVRDELDFSELARLLPNPADLGELNRAGAGRLNGPLLTASIGDDLLPLLPGLRGTRTIGYTFFEDNYVSPAALQHARQNFDHIVAGSTACEERLRATGLANISTIVQGIDPDIFEPSPVERRYLRDKFVIFSGGKLELRKGQDVVVRAFKVMQDKYRDCVLMTAWHNPFQPSRDTMRSSKLVRFSTASTTHAAIVHDFLGENGIDVRRTINLAPKPNFVMPRFYKQTDVGLFPNRCEGGTNLVLMEYMACGKPAIASFSSGHRDVLTPQNSLPLSQLSPLSIDHGGREVASWDDPNLDEVVAMLELAYQQRGRLQPLAKQAGEDMRRLTWRHTAEQFLALLLRSGA